MPDSQVGVRYFGLQMNDLYLNDLSRKIDYLVIRVRNLNPRLVVLKAGNFPNIDDVTGFLVTLVSVRIPFAINDLKFVDSSKLTNSRSGDILPIQAR